MKPIVPKRSQYTAQIKALYEKNKMVDIMPVICDLNSQYHAL